ncbi:MAG: hypothetical protein ABFD62_18530, partial [Syntrophaceae bacterium]
ENTDSTRSMFHGKVSFLTEFLKERSGILFARAVTPAQAGVQEILDSGNDPFIIILRSVRDKESFKIKYF